MDVASITARNGAFAAKVKNTKRIHLLFATVVQLKVKLSIKLLIFHLMIKGPIVPFCLYIYIVACPVECSSCKEGAAYDGGKALSSTGHCEHYCSKWGFCGEGEKYENDPSAVCYGCAASNGNNLY